jgi:hypothetical protein
MRMTGRTAKFKMLNTGGGETVFGAWPNHDSGRQDDRLGGVLHQLCNSQSEPKSKRLGDPPWMILLCQKVIQMGNARWWKLHTGFSSAPRSGIINNGDK